MIETTFPTPQVWMDAKEAAAYTRHAHGSLRNMAAAGTGPKSFRVRGKRLYRIADLDAWIMGTDSTGADK